MANAMVLLCKRGNSTCGILFCRDMTFQLLVKKLLGKWNDLIEGSFSLSLSLRGHPNCFLDSQDDLDVLVTLAVALEISSGDVVVRDLAGGSCSDSTVVDASSSSSKGSGGEVGLLCAATTEVDLLPTFIHHETKVLKSAPWVDVLREVGQVFVGGVVSFRDSLCKYSLYHGFKFDYVRNYAQTVKANCSQRLTNRNCLWSIKAKLERHSGYFWIKEFNNVHTCGSDALSSSRSRASSRLIGRLISDEIRVTPSKRPFEYLQDMKMDFGVDALGGMETKRKKHLLNLFGLCAYVPTVSQFDALLTQLKEEGRDRVQCFLQNLSKEHWCHAHFPGKRYSELTSNIVECFNSWIRKERRLPIRDLVDKIRIKVMEKMSVRRDLAMKWKCDVCPEMDRRITQLFKESRAWTVKKSSDGKHIGKNLKEYVDRYYLVDSYREAYSKSINPIPTISKADFVAENDNVLLSPLCKRPPGRPRTERIPLTGVQVRKVKCGRCGKTGHHNRATCTEPLVG
ncbi:hypothetical protein Vadar_022164 [Vaccinium darrowii]|uniref:Uncharacterized protein n=1 Tax=Vaccinium darrowii TaxID=229202 RepID=A0ACB7X3B8_9ERIC|nr:hypothetical protein Vadar_022164 [Vaccinium darrowii]